MKLGRWSKSARSFSQSKDDLTSAGRSFSVSHAEALLTTAFFALRTLVPPLLYLTLTPLASPFSTRISSTCAPSLRAPPCFRSPATKASTMPWDPPTGKSSSQLGWYHSLNMKALRARRGGERRERISRSRPPVEMEAREGEREGGREEGGRVRG